MHMACSAATAFQSSYPTHYMIVSYASIRTVQYKLTVSEIRSCSVRIALQIKAQLSLFFTDHIATIPEHVANGFRRVAWAKPLS
jgi:hypothetical protein